jgi:hypothetical protein
VDCCPEMGCHLGWHFTVEENINNRNFCSTKKKFRKKKIFLYRTSTIQGKI